MDDLIRRQDAIEALIQEFYSNVDDYISEKQAVHAINSLPSVQSERKKGKWMYGEDEYGIDGYCCDKCGFFVPRDYTHKFINYIEDYNYCPSCGARMDGEENG